MKYLKFNYNLGPIEYSFLEKVLVQLIRLIFPDPNPDFSQLYGYIETWYIEYDETCEEDGTVREIGRDAYGRIIVKDPDNRNYGYWNDTNMGINDFIEQMHAEFISKEEFESVWNEELVRVDKKSYV